MLLLVHKEECPYCQKVRQHLSDKNVSYVSLVSASDAPSRKILNDLGGKAQVPFLIDFDKGEYMYESSDIITYVDENY